MGLDDNREIDYVNVKKTGPREILPSLQEAIAQKALQWNAGGHDRLQEKEVLQSALHGGGNDERCPDPGGSAEKGGEIQG